MLTPKKPGLFRLRNLAVGALGVGLVVGIWLGDLFKWPLGDGWQVGQRSTTANPALSTEGPAGTAAPVTTEAELGTSTAAMPAEAEPQPLESIQVIVDERTYFVQTAEGRQPQLLESIVQLAETTTGDSDGIRVRIYRTKNSRATSETRLREALLKAGIADNAVFLPLEPVE